MGKRGREEAEGRGRDGERRHSVALLSILASPVSSALVSSGARQDTPHSHCSRWVRLH